MNKKKVIVVLAIVLCLSILGDVTAAYFTAKDTAHNVITTGNVGINVVEQQKDGDDLIPYPEGPIKGVMPGARISKIVSVANTGMGDVWIRVQIDRVFDLDANAPEKLPGAPDPELMHLDINEDDWFRHGDWYYYKEPVVSGKSTTPLFRNVKFDMVGMGNAYQGATANVTVNAQAVQAKNNPLPANGDHSQIPGWPAEITK